MKSNKDAKSAGVSRRDLLKASGLALGGAVVGGIGGGCTANGLFPLGGYSTQKYTYFDELSEYYPGEALAADEMRITFLGTSCIARLSQECNSIFVEVGGGPNGQPADAFVFDCGTGVYAKYIAMQIQAARMNKVFITHLHGDHMSDLTHIYCFGPSQDRKSPLYVWGPAASGVPNPTGSPEYYDDGTMVFCENLRRAWRWHSESFSFQNTSYASYEPPTRASWGLPVDPVPVEDDDPHDGYALVPIELDWTKSGKEQADDNVAYYNAETGVKITHFPAIHCRKGSISYKLEWNGLSLIFSGDTKPNYDMIEQASGVDVLIHEMVVPAEVWAMKNLGITDPGQVDAATWDSALAAATAIQNSSHTPQGAFGYLLSQINPAPRLAVATHFQAADDTVASAEESVRAHYPAGDVTWATDFMVINVSASRIRQRRAVVSAFAFNPYPQTYSDMNPPKYANADGTWNPTAQIDTTRAVPANDPDTGAENYRSDGY